MKINFDILKNSNSRLLFGGQFLSQIFDKSMSIGLAWMFVSDFSSSLMPWFLAISTLPHLLLFQRSGRWIAKIGLLRTLVASDFFRAFVYVTLALLWDYLSPTPKLVTLFTFSFLANCAAALFNPAVLAAPPRLVKNDLLQSLNALIDSCFSFAQILGPILSLYFYPSVGLKGLFLIAGFGYLVAAILSLQIKYITQAHAEDSASSSSKSLKNILNNDLPVKYMFIGFLIANIFIIPLISFLPFFVQQKYVPSINTLANLELWFGIGTVSAAIALSFVHFKIPQGRFLCANMIFLTLFFAAFVYSSNILFAILSLALVGFFISTTNVVTTTFFQNRIPADDQPTFMSGINLITVAISPITLGAFGLIVSNNNIQMIGSICAIGLSFAALFIISKKEIRLVE